LVILLLILLVLDYFLLFDSQILLLVSWYYIAHVRQFMMSLDALLIGILQIFGLLLRRQ
jgi:hypothetical protein